MTREPLSVLVFQGSSGHFVALCLDYDFGAQSSSVEGAVAAFDDEYAARCQIAERRGERPFQNARRAPEEYWARFQAAKPVAVESGNKILVRTA